MTVLKVKGSRFWQYDFMVKGVRFAGSTKTTDRDEAQAVEHDLRLKAKSRLDLRQALVRISEIGHRETLRAADAAEAAQIANDALAAFPKR